MKSEDLIQKYLGLLSEKDYNEKTLKIFSNLVDINKDGYVFLFNFIFFSFFI
jgi:hypothetical protein